MKTAFILARGPSIAHYKPIAGATTYGVNDIFAYHPVEHLVTVDNPWLLGHIQDETLAARCEITKASNPKYWHFWKLTNAIGIEDKPGFTHTPLQEYNGINLMHPTLCPRWYSSAFVAAALAARHGHTTIITYGIDWIGHPYQEPRIPYLQKGWQMLANEMNSMGITMYAGHSSSHLATFLPVWNEKG